MKSQLHQIDFKTAYFVTNGNEDPKEKAHTILSNGIYPNDLVQNVQERSNDYRNLVNIINEDEIVENPREEKPMPVKTYKILKNTYSGHTIHYQKPMGKRGLNCEMQLPSLEKQEQFEKLLIEAGYTKITPKN